MVKTIYWISCIMMLVISLALISVQQPKAVAMDRDPVPTEVPISDPIVVRIPEHDEPVNIYSEDIPLTYGWQAYTQDTCRRYEIPYPLMLGLMEIESSFREDADSGWAYGICQIGYINEEWLADRNIDIYTTKGNIDAACLILGDYLHKYDTSKALMAYNCGEYGASDLWDQGIVETEYSRSVMEAANKWEELLK